MCAEFCAQITVGVSRIPIGKHTSAEGDHCLLMDLQYGLEKNLGLTKQAELVF